VAIHRPGRTMDETDIVRKSNNAKDLRLKALWGRCWCLCVKCLSMSMPSMLFFLMTDRKGSFIANGSAFDRYFDTIPGAELARVTCNYYRVSSSSSSSLFLFSFLFGRTVVRCPFLSSNRNNTMALGTRRQSKMAWNHGFDWCNVIITTLIF